MTVINTNVAATVTAQAMKSNQRSMETTMERLATGLRVNTAADDAAGLAIGTKMDSQIRGFEQAVRNANDGISLLQTADGAADQITGLLQRMRELAVQGQNDTNSTSDLDNLNLEFVALATEIDRIANDTQFNGINLLNSSSTITVTVGADEADTIDLAIGDFNLVNGATSTAAVQTITFSAVSDLTGLGAIANANAEIILTDGDGNTLSIDQTQMATAGGSGFSDSTVSQFAAAINTALGNNSSFAGFSAAATSTTTITMTQTTAGTGTLSKVSLVSNAGVSDVTSAAVTTTTAAGTSTAAAPMGANLGSGGLAYATAGDHVEASGTIEALDAAIQGVNTARADFGSNISRLGYTIDNLNGAITNTASAKSSIVDADYARETTELARTQIISQAATAMLSQANQQQQSVLALLK